MRAPRLCQAGAAAILSFPVHERIGVPCPREAHAHECHTLETLNAIAHLEVTDKLALLFVQHPSIRLPTCHSKTQGETVHFQVSLEPTEDRSTLRITKRKGGF